MKCYIARRGLIVISALALGLCFLQPPIHAEQMTEQIIMFPSIGLAPGQSLRLTLFNPDGEPVRARAQVHTSTIQVGMGDGSVRLVRGGTFHSFDLNRSDIPVTGEEGTGRVQLRASCWIRVSQPWTKIDGLAVSLETIEISDGTSNTILVAEVFPSSADGGGRDVLIGGDGRDVLIGIAPGQRLRATIFNPPSFDSEAGSEPQRTSVNGHVKVFDGSGSVIAQSEQAVIPQGAFRSFDFDRDSLPAGTGIGRQQVRIRPFFDFQSERLPPLLVSIEIVDNSTGKTQVLSGQQCLVFFLGGIPGN
jgi:hypothetical protein